MTPPPVAPHAEPPARAPVHESPPHHEMADPIQTYFSGEKLYGDDFGPAEIAPWFEAEREGYAGLGMGEHGGIETYGYHQLNVRHGFGRLPPGRFERVLGLGSSYGGEFLPIIDRLGQVTILEPSAALRSESLNGVPLRYVEPAASGDMPFADESFDLVMALGTLHHIPNVSHVVAEIGRVTARGGWVLIREPVVSLGDWRGPRRGLTPRERGIPPHLFTQMFRAAGLRVLRDDWCMFPTTPRLGRLGLGYNSRLGVLADAVLSRLWAWNYRYHATNPWQKVRPCARYYVLRRD